MLSLGSLFTTLTHFGRCSLASDMSTMGLYEHRDEPLKVGMICYSLDGVSAHEKSNRTINCPRSDDDLEGVAGPLDIRTKACGIVAAAESEMTSNPGSWEMEFSDEFMK